MVTIQQYRDCSTSGCRQLDLQLIGQILRIAPGVLTKFDHLNVRIGAGCHPYLQASAVKALEKAILQRGKAMIVNSAYRTIAQQAVLFSHFQTHRCGIRAAARPGASNHNTALAIDIEDAQGWRPYLERHGWDWIGSFDPMHFDYEGAGTKDLKWLSIKAFQQLWNLNNLRSAISEDGRWGLQTALVLSQTSTQGFVHIPGAAKPLVLPTIDKVTTTASLRQGMKGEAVLALRRALRRHGHEIPEDDLFDALTVATVKAFQLSAGLEADGVVGSATKKALGIG